MDWMVGREVQSPQPWHCQPRLASAGLSISYISFDVSDIFKQRRDSIGFPSGDRVLSRMDVGDGLPR